MALTVTRRPFEWSAAYNPMIYELESSLTNFYLTAGFTLVTISDENGFQLIELVNPHPWEVGDVIAVTNNAGDVLWISTVTSVPSANEIVIDKDYLSSLFSGATTVYGYANNYRCAIEVHAFIDSVDTTIGVWRQEPTLNDTDEPVFQFDIAPVLREFINDDEYDVHSLTVQGLELNNNSFIKFYIEFAEEYDIGDDGETVYTNHGYTPDQDVDYDIYYRWCNNAALQYDELIGVSDKMDGFVVQSGQSDTRFLTDMPSGVVRLKKDSFAFVYFLLNEANIALNFKLNIRTKDAEGNLIDFSIIDPASPSAAGSFSMLVDYSSLDTDGAKYACAQLVVGGLSPIGIPAGNVGNDGGFTEWGGLTGHTFNPGDTVYIDIEGDFPDYEGEQEVLSTTANTITTDRTFAGALPGEPVIFVYLVEPEEVVSEELCWLVDEECERYSYEFVFLNKKGGYDTFTMLGKADKSTNVERTGDIKYQILPDSFSPPNRQYASLQINSRRTLTARHRELNNTVFEWLVTTLIDSQDIYVVEDGNLIPINLQTDSVIHLTDGAKLNTLQFDFIYAFDRVTQSR